MKYEDLVLEIALQVLEELIEQEKQKEKDDIVKTSEVPTALTPLQRAIALRRKEANKYDNYIASKLLPGLKKKD